MCVCVGGGGPEVDVKCLLDGFLPQFLREDLSLKLAIKLQEFPLSLPSQIWAYKHTFMPSFLCKVQGPNSGLSLVE